MSVILWSPKSLAFWGPTQAAACGVILKYFKDHVFIVSEAYDHGMQVYNLRQLRNLKAPKPGSIAELSESAHYGEFGSAHNIVANEDTSFMYSVGSRTCDSGLHMVDVNDPLNSKFTS